LKIWSCPCATGEEPYTIAMIFDMLKKTHSHVPDVEIVATDIDGKVLDHARKGIFNIYSIHDLPEIYKNSYFTEIKTRLGPQYAISESIKNKVQFFEEDLTQGHSVQQKYDVVFCRNFLIYLNKESQKRVLKTIAHYLAPGGLLIIGKTEMVHNSKSSLFQLIDAKHHYYQKK
jgi:chemotaxis protein methyltransferase CheR